jgi:hypothetical protein
VHLETCAQCRTRLEAMEGNLEEFCQAHREAVHRELPAAAGPRALLKAHLADLAARERPNGWRPWLTARAFTSPRYAAVFAGVTVIALLFAAVQRRESAAPWQSLAPTVASPAEPIASLTPGATIPVTQSEVCSAHSAQESAAVPAALKGQVLQLYGVASREADAYEVDYLITPELGGATDVRNLWPEPYHNTVWNAKVKDQLENRLHQMVCHGDLDLATAQRDISTDWIAAYRKYFHVEAPLPSASSQSQQRL